MYSTDVFIPSSPFVSNAHNLKKVVQHIWFVFRVYVFESVHFWYEFYPSVMFCPKRRHLSGHFLRNPIRPYFMHCCMFLNLAIHLRQIPFGKLVQIMFLSAPLFHFCFVLANSLRILHHDFSHCILPVRYQHFGGQ